MSNIIQFPKKKRVVHFDLKKAKESMPKAKTVKGIKSVFTFLFSLLRWPVFLVMYWLRTPIIFLCNIVSVPMLFCWLFAMYAYPEKTDMVWAFGIISFTTFVFSWIYDFILMAISPQDMIRTL